MSRKLILHVDGSRVLSDDRSIQSFGWGMVALHDDTHHERQGYVLGERVTPLGGHHEEIAFVNGVLYARDQGFDFRHVTIFCDDACFGNAPGSLHPHNFQVVRAEQVMSRLHCVVKHCFTPDVIDVMLLAFSQCMIVKVKGHSRHVYQERVDYLAKFSAHQGCNNPQETLELLDLDAWLQKGIAEYKEKNGAYVRSVWHAPFVLTDAD